MTETSIVPEWLPDEADDPFVRRIAAEVHEWLAEDSTGHDMAHVWRVFALSMRLAEEEAANERVLGAAALTHDLHRVLGDGEYVHPEESLPAVRAILERVGFPEELIPPVLHCVEVHDEYSYRERYRDAESCEAEILRDADNLDAMGAVGIARTFAFTGAYGNPLWEPEEGAPSGRRHFDDKLFRLVEEMHTETARELAADRHRYMEAFVERFEREWCGER